MTPQQSKLYRYLLDRIDEPVSPTMQEMADFMGLSKSNVHRLVGVLERLGKLKRIARERNSVRAIRANPLDGVPLAAIADELIRRGIAPTACIQEIVDGR